jgi:hypothetical protein
MRAPSLPWSENENPRQSPHTVWLPLDQTEDLWGEALPSAHRRRPRAPAVHKLL